MLDEKFSAKEEQRKTETMMNNWDKIIKKQIEIQGPEVMKLISEVAEGLESYEGDIEEDIKYGK
jgi:hypothetical protein